jgi:hypothetical protein
MRRGEWVRPRGDAASTSLVLMLGGIVVAAARRGSFPRASSIAATIGHWPAHRRSYHLVEERPVRPLTAAGRSRAGLSKGRRRRRRPVRRRRGLSRSTQDDDRGRRALVRFFQTRGHLAIPLISAFFAVMGALENMQEEIIT